MEHVLLIEPEAREYARSFQLITIKAEGSLLVLSAVSKVPRGFRKPREQEY